MTLQPAQGGQRFAPGRATTPIETQEGSLSPDAFIGPGVFLTSRDFAGSEKGSSLLRSVERFDLCVIDEAHEIFAGIHKRFDRYGYYKEDSKDAQMAHRVRQVFANVPKLLLTATPIQNSLVELWGLTQWIEPTGTLLGNLATFREVFCDGDDRSLVVDQAHELRRRISRICQRTLRRQAQEFLEKPFVDRRALLLEYRMSPEERQVYDDVTRYLLEPNICAFSGNQRQLLLISFHRLMASSLAALAASLRKVAERLEKMLAGVTPPRLSESVRDFALDLEDELPSLAEDEETAPAALTPEKIQDELERGSAIRSTCRAPSAGRQGRTAPRRRPHHPRREKAKVAARLSSLRSHSQHRITSRISLLIGVSLLEISRYSAEIMRRREPAKLWNAGTRKLVSIYQSTIARAAVLLSASRWSTSFKHGPEFSSQPRPAQRD